MIPQTKNNNDNEPATKDDVAKVSADVAKVSADVAKVSADVAKVSADVAKVSDDVAKVSDDVDNLAIATKKTFDRVEKKMETLATKNQLANLKEGQDKLKQNVGSLQKGQDSLKENQQRILSIVESIDDHFKEHRDIPRRVEQLEVDVFKLQTRPR